MLIYVELTLYLGAGVVRLRIYKLGTAAKIYAKATGTKIAKSDN